MKAKIYLLLLSCCLGFSVWAQNIALNKPVMTSSNDGSGTMPGSNAVDGNTSTRWASLWSDPQWIDIDLKTSYDITKVVLMWETAAAKAYQIQVSYDNTSWTTIYSTTTGPGGTETLNIAGTGRYIRMYGTARATTYGYSLYEFQVYGTQSGYVAVTGVAVSPDTATVLAGGHIQLTAIVAPSNATNNAVNWSSSNSTVASVNASGLVSAVAPGNAIITAAAVDGGKTGSSSIIVTKVPVTGVSLPAVIPIFVGGSIQLNPVLSPVNATDKKVSWRSSNPAVATVNTSGLVTGLTAGNTSIAVTTEDGQLTDSATYTVIAAPAGAFKVGVSMSSEYKPMDASWYTAPLSYTGYKLSAQDSLWITQPATSSTVTTFNVNPDLSYQTIYGMGSSFDESSVYNLLLMSKEKRTEALRLLLDPVKGIGLNLWRLTIGTSDFTGRPWYTYDDMPAGETDTALSNFSIQKDKDYGIIQVIKEAQAINPNLRFFASPWSAPAWMKTSGNITGGYLADGMCQVLAQYYRKFIEAYAAEGIPLYAMTVQNEPKQISTAYPTMGVTAAQEIELTKAIKAEFKAHGITTKVWIFDHNFDLSSFPDSVLADSNAYAAADGTAFHDYGGDPTAMSDLHTTYPDKEIFFTERSAWGVSGMDRIAQYFRNYAGSYCSWVTMLDQNKQPKNTPFSVDPTLLIKGTSSADQYWAIPEVYLLGQYAKYVEPGARRIYSDYGVSGGLTNVAFLNPDGSIAMVVMNNSSSDQSFRVLSEGNQFTAKLPAKTVGTYVWQAGLPLSSNKLVDSTIGTTGQASSTLVNVYPNPVTNNSVTVGVQGFNKDERVMVSLYDLLGRRLYEYGFVADDNGTLKTPVSFKRLASQMYVIRIKGDAHGDITRALMIR